jgi:hypothetical protein
MWAPDRSLWRRILTGRPAGRLRTRNGTPPSRSLSGVDRASPPAPECVCGLPQTIQGAEARDYLQHLRELRVDEERWLTTFECPRTGRRWLLDHPHSERHGGGPVRLRTFDQVCQDVKRELNAVRALVTGDTAVLADRLNAELGDCWYPPGGYTPPA